MKNENDNAKLRQFIGNHFNVPELEIFCFDYFPEVVDEFVPEVPKSNRVKMLIEYCQRRGLVQNLLVNLEQERPEAFRQAFSSVFVEPMIYPDSIQRKPDQIFISYVHQNRELAEQLVADLQMMGYSVWIAPDSILPGEKWAAAISRGLEESGIFILLLSKKSVISKWIHTETSVAIDMEHSGRMRFFPILVEPCEIPHLWRAYQYISIESYQSGLNQLVSKLSSDETNMDMSQEVRLAGEENHSIFEQFFKQQNQLPKGLWILPPQDIILKPGIEPFVGNPMIRELVERIEHTLESYDAPAVVVEIRTSPSVTLFGVEPHYTESYEGFRRKVRVSEIVQLTDEIGVALQSYPIRIQAPVPGRGYVGIEVPNDKRENYKLLDALNADDQEKSNLGRTVLIGGDVLGELCRLNLSENPHMLIVGSIGSGKMILVRSLLTQLLLRNTPNALRLVLIDSGYQGLEIFLDSPHLLMPLPRGMQQTRKILSLLEQEVDNRINSITTRKVQDITKYSGDSETRKSVPYIVVVIHDFIELIKNDNTNTVELLINRLLRSGRKVGINVVLVSSRSKELPEFSGLKLSISTHIALAVNTPEESQKIIESDDASLLLGHGDMLVRKTPFSSPLSRVQSCFVSDEEIIDLVRFWNNVGPFAIMEEDDTLLPEIINFVLTREQVSTEVFQRKYKISFPRANRILNSLLRLGILTPNKDNNRLFDVTVLAENLARHS